MDEIVKAAMAKWPNVPAVYGWLELTARGEWRIKGEPIDNASIRDFIARNYAHDDHGNWFFQNGPQRVFVSLEATPLIYRLDESGRLQAHTGTRPRELRGVFADPEGRLLLDDRTRARTDRQPRRTSNSRSGWSTARDTRSTNTASSDGWPATARRS